MNNGSTMKFSISLDQRYFLNQKGYIPFYALLSNQELKTLNDALQSKKLAGKHDLWRENDAIKQIVFSRRLVNLVYELTNTKPLRIAFDHYLPEKSKSMLDVEKKTSVEEFFENPIPLQDRMSINPLVGMFLLILNTDGEINEETTVAAGGGYFILPTTTFSLDELSLTPNQRLFLIGYGDSHSQYLYELRDPDVHFLKTLGYVFGDRLNDNLHPILFR
jgi:hypothetical protein